MRTITFAKNSNRSATVLDTIPPSFTQSGPNGTIDFIETPFRAEGRVEEGFFQGPDLTLASNFNWGVGEPRLTELCGKRFFTIDRFSKAIYNAILNDAGKDFPHYLPIRAWNINDHVVLQEDECYLLRPGAGSRGVGFIPLADLQTGVKKNVSIQNILSMIRQAEGESNEFLLELFRKKNLMVTTDGLNKDESLYSFLSLNLEVVSWVGDIAFETRLMTNYRGEPDGITNRNRNPTTAGFEQARGCGQMLDIYQSFKIWSLEQKLKDEIAAFLAKLKLPVHSFDFFFTDDGRWGVFETCPEFGYTSLPTGWVADQAKRLVYELATVDVE